MLGISTLKNRRICSIKEIDEYKKLLIDAKKIEIEQNSLRGLIHLLYVGNEYIMMYPWVERDDLIEKNTFTPLALQNLCDTNLISSVDVLDEETLAELNKFQRDSDSKYLQDLQDELNKNQKVLKHIQSRLN